MMVAPSTGIPLSNTSMLTVEINENDAPEPMDIATSAWPPIISTSHSGERVTDAMKRMLETVWGWEHDH